MMPERTQPWMENGSRAAMNADRPEGFIYQHVSPLFYQHTIDGQNPRNCKEIVSEEQFWSESGNITLGNVSFNGFRLTDWFPRTPGVYWSQHARRVRERVFCERYNTDAELGKYFSPKSKSDLIEAGGIGTIRLRPRRIDGLYCWLATALTGAKCHGGIPLAIPDTVLRESGIIWGDRVNLQGRVRFLQDAGLEDTAASVHHARPLIVFIDKMEGVATRQSHQPIVITPVALFEPQDSNMRGEYRYTFLHCAAGPDAELDAAGDWVDKYATKHAGRVITNFDEQRPVLADAPLSYQRLVTKTYDRTMILNFAGPILANRIDQVSQETLNIGDIHMGHNIHVGGDAIINIDAVLSNVTQTIGSTSNLNSAQKSQLESLVQSMKTELDKLKMSHADESKEIAAALEKAVANAAKPSQERKKSLLEFSAKGLKEAAELVKDIAPNILTTADLIAKFLVGL